MILQIIKYLYFYEVPTLIHCRDAAAGGDYFFVLADEEKQLYTGKRVTAKQSSTLLGGTVDLKTVFEQSPFEYLRGRFNESGTFEADTLEKPVSEDHLPADDLIVSFAS